MKKILIIVLFHLPLLVAAQYNYKDSNRIGIIVGINQFTLNTNNFDSKPELGWNAGLSMRGNFYNNWEMVYAMQFSENNFSVPTTNNFLVKEDVKYKLASAQISLLLSYKIIENGLHLEFGPLIQINGKLTIDEEKENNSITGTALLAKDIQEISRFNFYPVVGITGGIKHCRANIQYQYGINNILGKLNEKDLGYNFKGNAGILSANLILYL